MMKVSPWVAAPIFEIESNPTIKIYDIKARRFTIMERDGEPSVARIINMVEHYGVDNKSDIKEYIVGYIKDHKRFDNLREALSAVAPQYVDMLDKLSVLK